MHVNVMASPYDIGAVFCIVCFGNGIINIL